MVFKENAGLRKILWLLLVLLILAALFVFVYTNPVPAMMEAFAPLFGGGRVELGGTRYPANAAHITAVISRWDMEELDRFKNLESADLRGSSCYQEIAAWAADHPGTEVNFSIPLPNGTSFDSLDEAFRRISEIPFSVTSEALNGMAEVAAGKIRDQGERMGVRDPESDVHILDKIKTGKPKRQPAARKVKNAQRGDRLRQ